MSKQYSDLVMSQNNDATYSKTLLDQPINLTRKRIVRNNKLALAPLQKPLKPTPYVAQRPVPKPRKKAPEKIEKFKKKLKFLKKAEITKIKNALKNNLANYSFQKLSSNPTSPFCHLC